MAYVENVAAFLEYSLTFGTGEQLFQLYRQTSFSMNDISLCW